MSSTTMRGVHGTVVEAENNVEFRISRGWGTHFGFRSHKDNWFHFPIPTLLAFDDEQTSLSRVFVLYRVEHGTVVRSVHVYDGPQIIHVFNDLNLAGEHVSGIDDENAWRLPKPVRISLGVGLSVCLEIVPDAQVAVGEVLFTAAGAEFIEP